MNQLRGRGQRHFLRVVSAAVGTAMLALALTACSGSNDKATKPKATTTTSKPSVVTKVSDAPRTTGYTGARKDVTGLTCAQDGKLWKVGGTVTNPTTASADYRIFTSFLDKANETRGLLQTNINGVAPNEAKPWSGELELPASDLHCVLRVERTP